MWRASEQRRAVRYGGTPAIHAAHAALTRLQASVCAARDSRGVLCEREHSDGGTHSSAYCACAELRRAALLQGRRRRGRRLSRLHLSLRGRSQSTQHRRGKRSAQSCAPVRACAALRNLVKTTRSVASAMLRTSLAARACMPRAQQAREAQPRGAHPRLVGQRACALALAFTLLSAPAQGAPAQSAFELCTVRASKALTATPLTLARRRRLAASCCSLSNVRSP